MSQGKIDRRGLAHKLSEYEWMMQKDNTHFNISMIFSSLFFRFFWFHSCVFVLLVHLVLMMTSTNIKIRCQKGFLQYLRSIWIKSERKLKFVLSFLENNHLKMKWDSNSCTMDKSPQKKKMFNIEPMKNKVLRVQLYKIAWVKLQ